MPLHEIRVLVETDDDVLVDQLIERIEPLICLHDVAEEPDHRCPNRWFILASQLDDADAAEWEDLLNE